MMATVVALSVVSRPTAYADAKAAPSWQQYVLGPSSPQVGPVAIQARGNVTNPKSLLKGRATTLTTVAGSTPASVLLDFGKDVAGSPYMDVTGLAGSPSLSLVTSESLAAIRTPASTTLKTAADPGATTVTLASAARLEVGDTIVLGSGADAQARTIDAFDPAASTVSFHPALSAAVPAGALRPARPAPPRLTTPVACPDSVAPPRSPPRRPAG
jgi:hypothetical protein